MKIIKEKITKQEFEKIDINTFNKEQIIIFLKENKDTAFSFDFLMKKFKINKTQMYIYLSKLVADSLVNKKKKYYMIK